MKFVSLKIVYASESETTFTDILHQLSPFVKGFREFFAIFRMDGEGLFVDAVFLRKEGEIWGAPCCIAT